MNETQRDNESLGHGEGGLGDGTDSDSQVSLHQEASSLRRDGGFPMGWKEWSAS